ncbi:MAG: hypothetical protein KA105_03780 [Caulobacter sp.]|jgi:hypothetical protein|nr:hypothetical protein [Caulobacter sp.]
MPAQTKEQRTVDIRRALSDYVASKAAESALENHPRYFAALAAWCYKRPGDAAGLWWRSPGAGLTAHGGAANDPLPAPANEANGYDAGAFHHPASETLIVVNRGTETETDWGTNASAFLGLGGRQMDSAVAYAAKVVRQARDKGLAVRRVVLTGQSLGAGLVQAQYCCLNLELAKQGQAPVAALFGYGFASAPFEKDVKRLLRGYGAPDDVSDAAHPNLKHWIRKGDPIRAPTGYLFEKVVGRIDSKLPDVWTISRNAQFPSQRGALRYQLGLGRVPAHDSFRYFLYFDRPADRCVVVNTAGSDFPLDVSAPPAPHSFMKIPDAYVK